MALVLDDPSPTVCAIVVLHSPFPVMAFDRGLVSGLHPGFISLVCNALVTRLGAFDPACVS